jgi:hypothetical protein
MAKPKSSSSRSVKKTPKRAEPTIAAELELFRRHVDAIGNNLIAMIIVLQEITKEAKQKLAEFEGKHCEIDEEKSGRTVRVPREHLRKWKQLREAYVRFNLSRSLLPRSLLVSLISQYDAYLGRLLRYIFVARPEILNGSERKLSFSTLNQFNSIDAVREFILEKEVESILRSSHVDQFKWMENAFSVPLTKGLDCWPTFIELTERRNLFVHTNGSVSSQYIDICRKFGCKLDKKVQEGQRLGVPQDYFEEAHRCVYEIGVKLAHVLWRKLFPEDRETADNNLVNITYDLVETNRLQLAIRLLDFACCDLKSFSNEATQLILIVNRAQAYRWNSNKKRCAEIMATIDWSAKSDQFRLANAVLSEDWTCASDVMLRIGKDGSVSDEDYKYWPLFREWRKRPEFLSAYEKVFAEPFPEKAEVQKSGLDEESRDEGVRSPGATKTGETVH